MNKAYCFLLCSMICLGISNVFFKKSAETIGVMNTLLWYYLLGSLFSLIIYSLSEKKPLENYSDLQWTVGLAFFLVISVYSFTIALKNIDTSIAAPIRSLAFIVTIIIMVSLGEDSLSIRQYLGIFLGIGAVYLLH